jgi:hypothetical protein
MLLTRLLGVSHDGNSLGLDWPNSKAPCNMLKFNNFGLTITLATEFLIFAASGERLSKFYKLKSSYN